MKAADPGLFSLRRLAKAAQVISAPPRRSGTVHELGLGISSRQTYKTFNQIARLPRKETGLANLRDVTSRPIPGLPATYCDAAWGALLGSPQLTVELSLLDPDAFLATGQQLPSDIDSHPHLHLGLAVVAIPDISGLTEDRELTATPVAGVAQLVLLTPERADVSSDAWLIASWLDSAEETTEALADLFELSDAQLPSNFPATAVLLTDIDEAWQDRELHRKIVTAAGLLDHKIIGYAPSDYLYRAKRHVSDTPPDVLIVADRLPARCEAVVDAYRATPKRDSLTHIVAVDLTSLTLGVRRRLVAASGISHGMFVVSPPSPAEIRKVPRLIPVQREGRKFWHARFKIIIECEITSQFYSRDLEGHGGSAFKRFDATAAGLVWNADLDADGIKIASKHKGPVGLSISWDELHVIPQKKRPDPD